MEWRKENDSFRILINWKIKWEEMCILVIGNENCSRRKYCFKRKEKLNVRHKYSLHCVFSNFFHDMSFVILNRFKMLGWLWFLCLKNSLSKKKITFEQIQWIFSNILIRYLFPRSIWSKLFLFQNLLSSIACYDFFIVNNLTVFRNWAIRWSSGKYFLE